MSSFITKTPGRRGGKECMHKIKFEHVEKNESQDENDLHNAVQ